MKFLKIENLSEEDERKARRVYNYVDRNSTHVLVGEKRFFLPRNFESDGEKYYSFTGRSDDIWIRTFPRSGATLINEMTWLLMHNLDFESAKSKPCTHRVVFFEFPLINEDGIRNVMKEYPDDPTAQSFGLNALSSFEQIQSTSAPRILKTHFPFSLHPNVMRTGSKNIYVARNPKDVAASNYHFHKSRKLFNCQNLNFETFWEQFQNGHVNFGPYWDHVKEAWDRSRHDPNTLFLFYEEMIQDLSGVVRRVSKFLGKSYHDQQYSKLCEHLEFSNIKKNEMVNFTLSSSASGNRLLFQEDTEHLRKGKKQAWYEVFTPEVNLVANKWIDENLKNTDLRFPHINIYD